MWTAPEGEIVESVCVTAGTRTLTFFADDSDGCYRVQGLGTEHVKVTRGPFGARCPAIARVVFHTAVR
jgi:hypothetical protein